MPILTANIITYKLPVEILQQAIYSLRETSNPEQVLIRVINNGPQLSAELDLPDTVEIIENGPNTRHLSKTWNQSVATSPTEWVLISNDDVYFKPGWFEVWQQAGAAGYELIGHGFSIFSVTKNAWREAGYFDEDFQYGYCEDGDFFLRCLQADIKISQKFSGFSLAPCLQDYFIHYHRDEPERYQQFNRSYSYEEKLQNNRYFFKKYATSYSKINNLIETYLNNYSHAWQYAGALYSYTDAQQNKQAYPSPLIQTEVSKGQQRYPLLLPKNELEGLKTAHAEKRFSLPLRQGGLKLRNILDVGAGFGAYSLNAKLNHPEARLHCFEASPASRSLLENNLAAFDHVVIHRQLPRPQGMEGGNLYLDRFDTRRNRFTGATSQMASYPVEFLDLDDFLSAQEIEQIDVLKISLWQSELALLRTFLAASCPIHYIVVTFHGEAERRELDTLLTDFVLLESRAGEDAYQAGVAKYAHRSLLALHKAVPACTRHWE